MWSDARKRISMPYPQSWMLNEQGVQALKQYLPGYELSAVDPQTAASVDVVFFDGQDMQTAAQTMLNLFTQMGANPQTGQGQMSQIAGKQAMSIPLTLNGQMGSVQGIMTFITINGGVVCVTVASPSQSTQAATPVFTQILAGIRFNG